MRVFITGGAGFIGSHLVEFHLNKGNEVHIIDNLSTGKIQNIEQLKSNPKCKFYEEDILTSTHLVEEVQWADHIYHFAAVVGMFKVISEPLSVVRNNILGLNHLLNTVVQTKSKATVIIASSSSVYGDSPKKLLSEADNLLIKPLTHPLSTYAISKISDEAIGYAYHRHYGIPLFLARMFNTIGPRQTGLYGMVVPRFVEQACSNAPLTVYGDGKQTRSFCDVRDLVVALDLLASEPESIGQSINIGNDYEISIKDLALLVAKGANSHSEIQYIPYKEAYGMEYTDIGQRRPDLSKLLKLIAFKHKWSLEATVKDLIQRKKMS